MRGKRWGRMFCVAVLAGQVFLTPGTGAHAASPEYSEEPALSGVAAAIQMAQEEIQDPFRVRPEMPESVSPSETSPKVADEKILLQGIGFGQGGAYAVIGGEVYSKGEEKKGIKMIEARRSEVDILVDGQPRTLFLLEANELSKAQERRLTPAGHRD